ncbi:hypothetical protein [Croceivirga sp. JEA036]|uniref:hypothetical protein n=1 Tax=Croceivirga sp. JEA036 TaxID=2721162 RepID=UPI00143BCFA6|nr:hypothetical protein [Croceivirga sp. JEA036]NJB36373.1 hypothetical protein [Croceivirga sp. JEA036]
MAKNLDDLNDILFDTLDKIRNGEMKKEEAQTVVNIGNTIVNAGKLQLQAFKLSKGQTGISLLGKNNSKISLPPTTSKREGYAYQVAIDKGYKNIAEAIAVMGKEKFNAAVTEYMKDYM